MFGIFKRITINHIILYKYCLVLEYTEQISNSSQVFLNNRTNIIKLNEELDSKLYIINCGESQENIFRPILFIVYINRILWYGNQWKTSYQCE